MTPHERAADFVASYLKITDEDLDITNFQRVLEMKVICMLTHSFKIMNWLVGSKEE